MSKKFHEFLSFFMGVMSRHCNKTIIIKALIGSLAFMSQFVLSAYGFDDQVVNSFMAVVALYFIVSLSVSESAWLGFFIGIFGFYWVAFSFYYFDMPYLIPLVTIGIGVLYGAIFWIFARVCAYAGRYYAIARAVLAVYFFDIMSPFGFNWLKPEILLSDTYFGVSKIHLLVILFSIAIFTLLEGKKKLIGIAPLLFTFQIGEPLELPDVKIKLLSTHDKLADKYSEKNILRNFDLIDKAIFDGYDMVVFPETAFSYPLNVTPQISNVLLKKSEKISILCGSLRVQGKSTYNSNYLFKDGKMQTLDKVIGVPFGEVNPMPKFMSDIVNDIFFNGAEDYKTAKAFSDFEIKGVRFRNAICYEATRDETYASKPKYMIALSNNTWFVPSLEPIMQKKLIKYYSRAHKTVIFHSVNMSESYIVR